MMRRQLSFDDGDLELEEDDEFTRYYLKYRSHYYHNVNNASSSSREGGKGASRASSPGSRLVASLPDVCSIV